MLAAGRGCELPERGMTIKLFVADDHDMVRAGLKAMLADTDIKIVGEAATGDAALRSILKHNPHVVLLDVQMPNTDGLAVLGRLRLERPELPILMFSAFDNPVYIARAVALGANGYLLKDISRSGLIDAIRRVSTGESIWPREQLRRLTGALIAPRSPSEIHTPLTSREADVLRLIVSGATNKDIADALEISYETVKEHVGQVLLKIGVVDRTQAAVWAIRAGIV
jgi:DNA-binding NarL/FixJ family response regulator